MNISLTPHLDTRSAARAVIRQATIQDAEHDFYDACFERHGVTPMAVGRETARLAGIARILAKAVLDLEVYAQALDMAQRGCDAQGLPVRAEPFKASEADECALVEALLFDRLTPEAEALTKAMLRHNLRGGQC